MGGSSRLSVYNGSDSRSVTGGDYDIYAPLRRKKKSRSLNGETHLLEVYGQELSIDGKGETETPEDRLLPWLRRIHMHQYKELLVSNGYDDLNFMDQAVMDDSDLLAIGIINAAHRETLLKAAAQLPTPSWRLTKAELNSMSVDDWLTRLHLTEYGQAFRKHEVSELKKIRNIWEVELETMLDIDKVGHRRRIMNSFAEFSRESMLMDDDVSFLFREGVFVHCLVHVCVSCRESLLGFPMLQATMARPEMPVPPRRKASRRNNRMPKAGKFGSTPAKS